MTQREGGVVFVIVCSGVLGLFLWMGWFFREELRTAQSTQQVSRQLLESSSTMAEVATRLPEQVAVINRKVEELQGITYGNIKETKTDLQRFHDGVNELREIVRSLDRRLETLESRVAKQETLLDRWLGRLKEQTEALTNVTRTLEQKVRDLRIELRKQR